MRGINLIFLLLFLAPCAVAQNKEWLPITQQDWDVKEVPRDPGAAAIQLYYSEQINDPDFTRSVYHRIKILSEKGLQPQGPADVAILVPPGSSVSDLKARTIHPDGTTVDFTGKPFEKIVVKGRGFKYLAKTFTFPDVTVGSIIEYKYVLNTPINTLFLYSEWTVQHDLFTVKENLSMTPYLGGLVGLRNGYQVSEVNSNLPRDVKLERKGSGWQLTAQNLPAFPKEAYMPPENNYKPEVRFFYIDYQPDSDDRFWHDLGKTLYEESERFIGNHSEVREAAVAAMGQEAAPEGKLQKLYARAQQIRNLSFERERSEEEKKKEALQENQNVVDVLGRGYGSHNEINRLFVAMARAAGFDASILATSDRKESFFVKGLLSRSQVAREIVSVHVNGKEVYLDPGTKFCPLGLLPWEQTSTQALKLDKKGSELVVIPPATQDKAVVMRSANVALDSAGTLKGEIAVQYTGGEALERRLDGFKTDDAGRKKMLEDELKDWLGAAAIVKITNSQGWEDSLGPLTATFSIEIPDYASVAGKRVVMPTYLFQTKQIGTFKQSERRFPVYFPYAFSEMDKVAVSLPSGYHVENVPEPQETGLPFAKYRIRTQASASQLVTERILLFNGIFFPLERYSELKGFFGKVQTGDEQQAVMQGAVTNAQNSN